MAHVMNMKTYGTGVSGETVGLIIASYPVNAICTATCNGVTLTSNASGRWIFQVPFAGTWTLTSYMPGMESDVKTATITNVGDVVEVTLYIFNLFYNTGDQYVETTGGWIDTGFADFEETYILIQRQYKSPISPYPIIGQGSVETINNITIKSGEKLYVVASSATINKHARLILEMKDGDTTTLQPIEMVFSYGSSYIYTASSNITGRIIISNTYNSDNDDAHVIRVYSLISS